MLGGEVADVKSRLLESGSPVLVLVSAVGSLWICCG